MANRLAGAASPYLRQHAGNPVGWHPWREEAFALAREQDKPIFLSIGYSTCHWCHVMAHESFENDGIAAVLNEHFIAIKVDREERPDVDRVYMAYVQALTGRGGWPLSAWLTPGLRPFYAGTYFPPEDRDGRPGFPTILKAIARGWREDRKNLVAEADRVVEALKAGSAEPESGNPVGLAQAAGEAFEKGYQYYVELFDGARGGFGSAPKFPRPGNLSFLLCCAALQGTASEAGREAIAMVSLTLSAMARGGIHDHVGGGFHRYAVDEDWFVPHFEKMLYDQAQIATVAIEAWQAGGDERHAWLVRDILDYVLRDLAAEAGLYSAEDADSLIAPGSDERAEGAFYVWTSQEVDQLLGPDASFFSTHFGLLPQGNVSPERDPQSEFSGRNILAQRRPLSETAAAFKLSPEEASDRLVSCLERLKSARSGRSRPHLDDKIVAAWNGLAITALARASVAPADSLADRREAYLQAALRAARFVQAELLDAETGELRRAYCRGIRSEAGFSEDYACVIQAWLDLYEATFDERWLEQALVLQHKLDELFWDADRGGYFNSKAGAADIVVRLKEDYDGAEPAASSVAALNLLRLASLVSDESLRDRGRRTLAAFRGRWMQTPQAMPQMLCALEVALEAPRHVVLTGDPRSPEGAAMVALLHSRLGPRRSLIALDATPGSRLWFASRSPWLADMKAPGSRPAAFVCEEFTCKPPAFDSEQLKAALVRP